MSKVEIKNVSFSFGEVKVLDQVNLTIKDNDFLGIIGPNGGGKTTLLKIILGLLEPDQGEVRVFGQPPQQGRRQIGYVPQRMNFDRDFPISVWEVVLMGCLSRRGMLQGFTDEDKAEVKDALEKVGMLKFKDHPIGQLSQGQQQRVFIARALASSPKLLLLDEPTASVDPAVQKEFYSLLTLLNQHMPVVLVSHDIDRKSVV